MMLGQDHTGFTDIRGESGGGIQNSKVWCSFIKSFDYLRVPSSIAKYVQDFGEVMFFLFSNTIKLFVLCEIIKGSCKREFLFVSRVSLLNPFSQGHCGLVGQQPVIFFPGIKKQATAGFLFLSPVSQFPHSFVYFGSLSTFLPSALPHSLPSVFEKERFKERKTAGKPSPKRN